MLFTSQALGSLPYTDSTYVSSISTKTGQSVGISASGSFSSCTCDLTAGGCDIACCCDSDCPSATVSQWRLSKNYCLDEINDQKILTFSQCLDRTFTGGLDDLQDGLKVYDKNIRALFCVTSSSSRETVSSFYDNQRSVGTAAQFNTTKNSLSLTTVTNPQYPQTQQLSTVQQLQGYSAMEPLLGYRNQSDTTRQYNKDKKLYLERKDLFGLCGRGRSIKYLQDQDQEECGYIPQPMTQQFCRSTLAPSVKALSLQVSTDQTLNTFATLVPGISRKFSLNNYTEMPIDSTVFHDSVYNSTDCSCDYLLLETHYTVYSTDFNSSFGVQSQINNITVDLIYGHFTPLNCTVNVQITQKNSIKFKQSIYSRKNSGGPGYIKGKKLLTGTSANATQGQHINMTKGGFKIRGADNHGMCYNLKTSLQTGLNTTNYTIETPSENLYMDDPILSFDDSTIYGCKINLTRQELINFCSNKTWQNMMLFQNFQLLKYVGRFGNSNPHYLSDWVQATVDSQKDKSLITASWDEPSGTCVLPSAYFVQIFYSKINTRSDPQYQIVKVVHYADTLNAWVYKKPDPTQGQDFQAILSLQFYEVDQDENFYAPPTPNPFKALPRNILYPFYVYGGSIQNMALSLGIIAFTVLSILQ
ncbi:UNKNOWN [Stylonychia lemnae]|uniref:Tectonic-1-3 N-terminal domain-containing protein n=1 Tax=Stylonychia lemnae TaxID=5949 RepID=A0A078AVH4_STYLE|nr:UNKNOWN [Stylonychia lemnae]|eukprot:CDW85277.1 UNKNOWN [Stylonychia lemnae]